MTPERPNEPSVLALAQRIIGRVRGATFVTDKPPEDIRLAVGIVGQAQRIKRLEAALEKIDGGDPFTDGYWLSAHQMAEIAREALKECQT